MDGCITHRPDFRSVPLAESRARSLDIHRRRRDGMDVRTRAQHHSARDWPSHPRLARVVGLPPRMAPPPPRRPRLLPKLTNFASMGFHTIEDHFAGFVIQVGKWKSNELRAGEKHQPELRESPDLGHSVPPHFRRANVTRHTKLLVANFQ